MFGASMIIAVEGSEMKKLGVDFHKSRSEHELLKTVERVC